MYARPSQTPIMEFAYVLVSLILTLFFLHKLSNKSPNPKLPPGPSKLPILGSMHHLLTTHLPHRRFRDLSASFGPLMHLKLGEISLIVASSPETAKEIMKTHDVTFATRPLFPAIETLSYGGKSLSFGPYGEYWRRLRKVCVTELLSAKRVQSFRHIREEEARSLMQSICLSADKDGSTSTVNLSKMLVRMTNNIAMRVAVGEKREEQDGLMQAIREGSGLASGFDLADLFPSVSWMASLISRSKDQVKRCHEKMDEILESIVQKHKEKRKMVREELEEDFVDVLLRIQEDGELLFELTNDSIKALVLDMFGAASETSSSTLQWAMSELIRNPTVMKTAQLEVRNTLKGKPNVTESDIKELSYLQNVIKETLRLHPPIPLLLPRECQNKCEVMGYEIPTKARVVINAWAIGRDPKYWENAEEFKPERFEGRGIDFKGTNFEFLPFGAGRRMCAGMQFGMATVELPLAQLLYHFDWELPTDAEMKCKSLDLSESFGITSHRKFDLLLQANIHHAPE